MPDPILDPTGGAGAGRPDATVRLAPRPAVLRGTTVGLLENTKQNADRLLGELGRLLIERHGAATTVLRTKTAFALPVPSELLTELKAQCDVVVTGVGDCGSCSASAVADGIAFEAAGLPAAVICSDAFRVTADAMAQRQGFTGYRYLTTPHPVAVLGVEQVEERARQLLPEVVAMLTAGAW